MTDSTRFTGEPMKTTIQFTNNRLSIISLGTLVLIVLILLLPNFLAAPLSDDRAETEVRAYLEHMLTQKQLTQLKESGLSVPDMTMALQWQDERTNLKQLIFQSTTVRVFPFTPPVVSSRLYLVRAKLLHADQTEETRIFSMSVESKLSDFFWVDEKPAWFWSIAI